MDNLKIPDGMVRCPACKGTGEYGETRYQPVEGMAYMDAPAACPHCMPERLSWANYPHDMGPRGYLTEERSYEVCDELDLCHGCQDEPQQDRYSLCPDCAEWERGDQLYHAAVDDGRL
jgi:hypothetical protein